MTDTGYLSTSNRHPVSLGLAVALTGAGLTVLLLVKPMVQNIVPEVPLTAREIAIQIAPPPLPPKHEKLPETVQPKTLEPIDPILIVPTHQPNIPTVQPGTEGLNPGPVAPIDIKPLEPTNPVLTEAMPDPRFAGSLQPPYPAALQRMEVEGKAIVRVQINVDGRVLRVEAVNADNEGFLTATREWALRHWRFKPAMRDGVATTSWKIMTVHFQMNR